MIHFVREGLRISRESDPSTEMMWGMLALMARQFAQNLSLEVRKGMNEAQAAGLWMFKAPIGFRNARNAAGRSAPLEHDEIAAPILTKIFTAYATGAHTLRSCAELADEMGLRTPRGRVLAPQEISYVLRHPLYAGWIPVNGHKGGNRAYGEDSHLVEAAHEPRPQPRI